jgi:hypothetical protein
MGRIDAGANGGEHRIPGGASAATRNWRGGVRRRLYDCSSNSEGLQIDRHGGCRGWAVAGGDGLDLTDIHTFS